MKKAEKLWILTVLLIGILSFFSGCTPAKKETLTGIYVLTEQTRQANNEEEATDEKARDGIAAYLIVDGSDRAVYVYKTNDQKTVCKQLAVSYETNDEDKVTQISFSDGMNSGTEFSLYVDQTSETVYLRKTQPHIAKVNYTTTVKYERISKKTDLSVVSDLMGEELSCVPYEWIPFHGFSLISYSKFEPEYVNPNVYYALDINGSTQKATVYWCEKADVEHPHTKTVDVALTDTTLTVGDTEYAIVGTTYCERDFTVVYEGEDIAVTETVGRFYVDSLDDYFRYAIDSYVSSNSQE